MTNGAPPGFPKPDFESMTWECPCCGQKRSDKYIRTVSHDVSVLFGSDTGTIFVNCKYCTDMPKCKERAFDRSWIIDHFFKQFALDKLGDVNATQ